VYWLDRVYAYIARVLLSAYGTLLVRRESVYTYLYAYVLFHAPLKYANGACDRIHEERVLFRYKLGFKWYWDHPLAQNKGNMVYIMPDQVISCPTQRFGSNWACFGIFIKHLYRALAFSYLACIRPIWCYLRVLVTYWVILLLS
jgi:hypothetical protein